MRVAAFDERPGGHHPGFLAVVARAAVMAGHDLLCLTAAEPPDGLDAEWVQVIDRSRPVSDLRAGRANVARALDEAERFGADAWWSLHLDHVAPALDLGRLARMRHTHILHRVDTYDYAGRRWRGRVRTALSRRAVRSLTRHGGKVVVHTDRARSVLESVGRVSIEQLTHPGWPAPSHDRPAPASPTLLWIGGARADRDLEAAVGAVRTLRRPPPLTIVGRHPAAVERRVAELARDLEVTRLARFATQEELAQLLALKPIVVLAYNERFARAGAASGLVIDTLAHGVPVVATSVVAEQFPDGYPGLVVAAQATVDDLARALEVAVETYAELCRGASGGPAVLAERHDPVRYVEGLLRVPS